ncbi:MAG: AIPR family protein [Nitrosomonas sp.]|uniref:AIPR family protein n=1 Tax=Nitrosomonas sp. TaxID=42353 RepID=UPI0027330E07|nr:AIPR family protein [Nitrosomonas sp.]MDP3279457.1 AIPR family protein [Nitrosomonas sp.]MDP3662264.1 AIPR family protein [Nitrosomonas sp.]MDZ4107375.1 AIPR family protein [Nitrosomonas sp.]
MAKNDRLLLDGIIDDRVASKLPSAERGEAFEYLAIEQILKEFDLSTDEILYGSIDGRQDGGIDGFFIIVNGHLLQDAESFVWPRSNSELNLALVSCKHHDTFRQGTLDSLIATLTELIDFAIEDIDLKGAYSEKLLKLRSNLKYAYRKLSPRLTSFSINIYYASRGDTNEIGYEVEARGKQIASLVQESFGSCTSDFNFVGATELINLHRKIPNYTLELPFVEALTKGERYVVLARLSDYYKFISEDGKLRRYLFESNVRDFIGLNRVNEDIKATLNDKGSTDFWWLNNGVTILASSAAITGKSIQASDIQIVNGLQTTESIFRHFEQLSDINDDRCILVKVIITQDEVIRDAIIRATNNQTDVELASLHATDKIQRDIEEVLLRHGLFYERRKNFYANQGHSPSELVTPLYVAAGYITLVLKKPHTAASLKSKFMRSTASYEKVFDENAPLNVWPKIAYILKKVDAVLELFRPKNKPSDNFLKRWRYITALLVLSLHYQKFMFSVAEITKFDVSLITPLFIEKILQLLHFQESTQMSAWTSKQNVLLVCKEIARIHGITDVKGLSTTQPLILEYTYPPTSYSSISISAEFIESVRSLLPSQPWKPGIHLRICTELKCETSKYFSAVEKLIEDGIFFRQRDGIVYDSEGNVVSIDPERVNPETMELFSIS